MSSSQGFFGTGADGSYTLDGNQAAVSGLFSKSGSTYTLLRDAYFISLAIDNGVTLDVAGYRINVSSTFTNSGTVSADGGAGGNGSAASGATQGSGGSAGTGASSGYLAGGSNGATGGAGGSTSTGTAGSSGASHSNATIIGSNGVDGSTGGAGTSSGGVGGTGKAVTASPAQFGGIRNPFTQVLNRLYSLSGTITLLYYNGGSAGSGGGGAGAVVSGTRGAGGGGAGSGGNGGIIVVLAYTLAGAGVLKQKVEQVEQAERVVMPLVQMLVEEEEGQEVRVDQVV